MKYTLGIIGVGVMGQAIMSRIIDNGVIDAAKISAFDIDQAKIKQIPYNIDSMLSAQELLDNAEFVLIAVKPQHYSSIFDNVVFNQNNTILSIMAGVKISTLRQKINTVCPIVRIMPNTPCRIGKGVSALCFENVPEDKKSFVIAMFDACGATVVVKEELFDAVTSVSGSGPAYVYMFADAMIKGGLSGGLNYEDSKQLALNTIIGTAELALQSEEQLSVLTDRVCSKGGTTIEAVEVFRKRDLEGIIVEGMTACKNKSKILSETL